MKDKLKLNQWTFPAKVLKYLETYLPSSSTRSFSILQLSTKDYLNWQAQEVHMRNYFWHALVSRFRSLDVRCQKIIKTQNSPAIDGKIFCV